MMKRNQKYSDDGKEVADDVKFVATHGAAGSAE
jgi:PTS system galactitol-specific IIC component